MGNTVVAGGISGCSCVDRSGCCKAEPPTISEGVKYKFAPAAIVLDKQTVWDDVDIAKDVFEEQTVAACVMSEDTLTGASEALYAAFSESNDQPRSVTVTYPDGSVYIGQLRQGLREGHGIWSGAGIGSYEGQWRRGQQYGRGRRIWPDGQSYVGEFIDGRPIPPGSGRHEQVVSELATPPKFGITETTSSMPSLAKLTAAGDVAL